ncbi:MAG: DUF1501 domain-containing protein [Chloroflexi bacterium]|nr:DUF1501 domain-containing protein [Chloroflexota bacterium]
MIVERREFLKHGVGLVTAGLVVPSFLAETARFLDGGVSVAQAATRAGDPSRKILVVVLLAGGNDGINTLVPYGDPLYYQGRPSIAVPREQVLKLDDRVGLSPALKNLKARYDRGQVAVVQGVGYPNPNRSHFRAMDIWQTAVPDRIEPTGWLGRYLQTCGCGTDKHLEGISVGTTVQKSFWTELTLVPAISNLAAFQFGGPRANPAARSYEVEALRRAIGQSRGRPEEEFLRQATQIALDDADTLGQVAQGYQTSVDYPQSPIGESLKTIAQVIAGDVGTRVFFATLGGFDTHANQSATQQRLLTELDGSIEAFMQDVERLQRQDDVLLMTFSEFGRRVNENASNGTDHGTAEPLFMVGGGVKGGLHGRYPSLSDLDRFDLKHTTDFRTVYSSVLQDWLSVAPDAILGGTFGKLPVVA